MSGIWQRFRSGRQPELTCAEVVELVSDYLEGSLSEAERARFEEHLSACDGCTAYLDQMRATIEVVGRVEADDLSEQARTALLETFRSFGRA